MKKITLTLVAIVAAFTMNAQTDCANAQSVTVADDASTTVNATSISGTAPSIVCNPNFYDETEVTKANWYKYTASSNDVVVTVNAAIPTAQTDYYASFNIYDGSCGNLTCLGGDIITQNQQQQLQAAEHSFLAQAGSTYYIVFDDFYEGAIGTPNAAFDFNVTTSTNVPVVPGVTSNPTPADQATGVAIGTTATGETSMDFAWDAPTTGGSVASYLLVVSQDPTFQDNTTVTLTTPNTSVQGLHMGGSNYFTNNTTYYWMVIPQNVAGTPDQANVPSWSFTTEQTAGVNDVNAVAFTHYANHNSLVIDAQNNMENIAIFNLLGQQVTHQKVNSKQANINISSFNAGVYLAQVQVEGKTQTFKFVKK